MLVAKIQVSGTCAKTIYAIPITAGMIGGKVEILYTDPVWDGLAKTVVFYGAGTKDVLTQDQLVTIPAEVIAQDNVRLKVGIYGTDAEGVLAIPTLWADLGTVKPGADPSGDTTTDPALPVWAQLQGMIGDLDDLDTDMKISLVAAVNEALTKGGGSVDDAAIRRIVAEYLAANPPEVTENDPTVPPWAKQPSKPTYNAAEVGAISKEDLQEATNEALAQAKASGEFDGPQGPAGPAGADGAPGPVGATPNIQIGTVETLAAGSPATASMGGTLENPILNLGIPQGATGSGGSGISVTGATVGQTVKIAAVDESGKPTAWEPVDLPSGGGGDLQWYKVAETETTEEITKYVVSQDFDGNPIKSYNPVAIALYFATPADSTQASVNGSPWIYPSASSKSNYIRSIGSIAGWKTNERTNTEVFFGSEHGLIGLGNANLSSMNMVGLESSIMDGVSIMFNTSGDHFPIGTHFIVSVLGARP